MLCAIVPPSLMSRSVEWTGLSISPLVMPGVAKITNGWKVQWASSRYQFLKLIESETFLSK